MNLMSSYNLVLFYHIDEDALKADLSNRLTITLNALDVQRGFAYRITRSPKGDVTYNKENLLIEKKEKM